MVALSIFLVVAGAVAGASVQVASVLARTELKQDVLATMDRNLDQLSASSFDDLAGERFGAPSPCGDAAGSRQRSCQQVNGRDFEVRYTTSVTDDGTGGPTPSAAVVALTARTTLPDGTSVSRTRKVPASALGLSADTAVVRVRAVSPDESSQLPVWLLDATGAPVASAVPFSSDVALVKVPGDACSGPTGPCHLGVADPATNGGNYWSVGSLTMSPPDVLGPASRLSLAGGTFTELSVRIGPVASARIRLLAQSADGPQQSPGPDAVGSVCLWATFSDGISRRSVPACNDPDPTSVTLDGFTDPATGARHPFPEGFSLTVTTDPPEGTCATSAQTPVGAPPQGATGDGGALDVGPADVCTSWTWGTPTRWGPQGQPGAGGLPRTVELSGTSEVYDLVWDEASASDTSVRFASVSVGATAACATTSGSQLWCWGSNANGVTAQGSTAGVTTAPRRVGTDTGWSAVSVGGEHACGIRQGGLWCWGSTLQRASGIATSAPALVVPTRVGTDTDWVQVSAGSQFTCGRRAGGTTTADDGLYCWGRNDAGQLADAPAGTTAAASSFGTGANTAPTAVATGTDGNLWVAMFSSNELVRYSTGGAELARYATGGSPTSPVAAPDGSVWIAEPGSNTVSRVDPAAPVATARTAFDLTAALGAQAGVANLAVGPDGKVWFTATTANKVGYVNPDGSVESFAAPGGPQAAALGPDGSLWFTTRDSDRVGTVTADGTVTMAAATSGDPVAITGAVPQAPSSLDTSGGVWVADALGNAVRRLTGGRTESASYATPSRPGALAVSNGWLWAVGTDPATNTSSLLRQTHPGTSSPGPFSTAGTAPAGASISSLTGGPDGRRWYTTPATSTLWRSTLVAPYDPVGSKVALTPATSVADRPLAAGATAACLGGWSATAGTVRAACWGDPRHGQLGGRTEPAAGIPAAFPAGPSAQTAGSAAVDRQLSVGARHACVVRTDDSMGCWGTDADGQVGSRSTPSGTAGAVSAPTPVPHTGTLGAPGPDGRLWATTLGAATALDPATGVMSTYPAPTVAGSITAGGDGAMWYAAPGGRLGRISVTGEVTTFPFTGTAGDALGSMTAGPDGALWFVAPTTRALGRLSTAGEVTLYPTGDATPTAVAAGPGNKLWFAIDGRADALGTMTTGGGLDTVTLSDALDAAPLALAGDGTTLWVASGGGAQPLAAVDTQGATTKVTVAASGATAALAVSPTGTLWWRIGDTVGTHSAAHGPAAVTARPGTGLAVTADGTVWAGGTGVVWRLVPGPDVAATVDGSWRGVSAGLASTCGIRTDGSLWCWGANASGQLGLGDRSARPTPTRVGSQSNWLSVSTSTQAPASCAVDADGGLWCWGLNANALTAAGTTSGTTDSPTAVQARSGRAGRSTPATGDGAVGAWSKPRAASLAYDGTGFSSGCATDANTATRCISVDGAVAEYLPGAPGGCATNPFCLSATDSPPRLVSPSPGTGLRPPDGLVAGVAAQVDLVFADPDGGDVQWRLSGAPAAGAGTLSATPGGPALDGGTWSQVPSGSTVTLWFTPTGSSGLVTFDVAVRPPGGSARDETVALYDTVAPYQLTADTVTAAQGGAPATLVVRVTNTDGTPAAATPLTASSDTAAFQLSPPVALTDASGVARFQVAANNASAGSPHTVRVMAPNLREVGVTVSVTPTAGAVAASAAAPVAQGGSSPVTVTAQDRAGAPLAQSPVRLWVTNTKGETSALVRPATGVCVTDGAGACGTTLDADPTAPPGNYVLWGGPGAGTQLAALTVTRAASRLEAGAGASSPHYADQFAQLRSAATVLRSDTADTSDQELYSGPANAPLTIGGASGFGATWVAAGLGADPLAGPAPAYGSARLGGDAATSPRLFTNAAVAVPASFTMELWLRPDTLAACVDPMLVMGQVQGARLELAPDASGTCSTPRLVAGTTVVEGPPLVPGRTVHLAGAYSPARAQLFVDGRAVSTVVPADPTSFAGYSEVFSVGALAGQPGVTGLVAAPGVYPTALGESTVARTTALAAALAADASLGAVQLSQGPRGAATLTVTARSADGSVVPGATVTRTLSGLSSGIAVSPSSAVTDAGGRAVFTVSATRGATAGEGLARLRFDLAAGAQVAASPAPLVLLADVAAVPFTLTADDVLVPQGGRGAIAATVLDGAGAPMGGVVVTARSGSTRGIQVARSATTGADGVARIDVSAAPDASLGAGSDAQVLLTVASPLSETGQFSDTVDVTATAGIGKVAADPTTAVAQGASSPWRIKVTDADDAPLPGQTATASCTVACGLSFGGAAVTGADGVATFTVVDTDEPSAAGSYQVAVTISGRTYPVTLKVTTSAQQIDVLDRGATPSVQLRRGGFTRVFFKVTGPSGSPVPACVVRPQVSGLSGLRIVPGLTDAAGRGSVLVSAGDGSDTGSGTLTLSCGDVSREAFLQVGL